MRFIIIALLIPLVLCVYAVGKDLPDELIEVLVETGGSYTVLEDAQAQDAWAKLMIYLDDHRGQSIKELPLPFGVKYYGLAVSGKETPAFLVTSQTSGFVTITLDGKGNITPKLKVDNDGKQSRLGDEYQLSFMVSAGKTYSVTINRALSEAGLYSISAKFRRSWSGGK
ncbi:MAG: hypothetical protein LBQ18_00445 [Campylobacteraceae bacterium]|nr:hypothetical protein [Campylobacteraceae bacterium]